ncbi:MAG: hypothetical protein FWD61_12510 [Phycisphaerales bacterium]|nr:hypothetical protein [Phycisphaerales bacterium]
MVNSENDLLSREIESLRIRVHELEGMVWNRSRLERIFVARITGVGLLPDGVTPAFTWKEQWMGGGRVAGSSDDIGQFWDFEDGRYCDDFNAPDAALGLNFGDVRYESPALNDYVTMIEFRDPPKISGGEAFHHYRFMAEKRKIWVRITQNDASFTGNVSLITNNKLTYWGTQVRRIALPDFALRTLSDTGWEDVPNGMTIGNAVNTINENIFGYVVPNGTIVQVIPEYQLNGIWTWTFTWHPMGLIPVLLTPQNTGDPGSTTYSTPMNIITNREILNLDGSHATNLYPREFTNVYAESQLIIANYSPKVYGTVYIDFRGFVQLWSVGSYYDLLDK